MRHAASMDMTSLSLSRCSDATSEGDPRRRGFLARFWVVRASEDYACTIRAAIRNVKVLDGLPPFSGECLLTGRPLFTGERMSDTPVLKNTLTGMRCRWRCHCASAHYWLVPGGRRSDADQRKAIGPQPHPNFIGFFGGPPPLESRGRWRERGRMGRGTDRLSCVAAYC